MSPNSGRFSERILCVLICICQFLSYATASTITLRSLDVPDGRLENGRYCYNRKCSLSVSVCLDPLEASQWGGECQTNWIPLGILTDKRNSHAFAKDTTYGGWHNPQNVSIKSKHDAGFLFKCRIYQSQGNLIVDRFSLPVYFNSSATDIDFAHRRDNASPVHFNFTWFNPKYPKMVSLTKSPTPVSVVTIENLRQLFTTTLESSTEDAIRASLKNTTDNSTDSLIFNTTTPVGTTVLASEHEDFMVSKIREKAKPILVAEGGSTTLGIVVGGMVSVLFIALIVGGICFLKKRPFRRRHDRFQITRTCFVNAEPQHCSVDPPRETEVLMKPGNLRDDKSKTCMNMM